MISFSDQYSDKIIRYDWGANLMEWIHVKWLPNWNEVGVWLAHDPRQWGGGRCVYWTVLGIIRALVDYMAAIIFSRWEPIEPCNCYPNWSDQGVTIFSTMSALAQRPHAPTSHRVFRRSWWHRQIWLKLLCEVTEMGITKYAAGDGYLPLRQQVSLQFQQRDQITLDPFTEITITPGADYWFICSIQAVPFIQAMKSLFLTQVTQVMILRYGLQAVCSCTYCFRCPEFKVDWDKGCSAY